MKPTIKARFPPVCSICGGSDQITNEGYQHLCQPCADKNRAGRDLTTQRSRLAQTALRGKSDMAHAISTGIAPSDLDIYAVEAAALMALDDLQCNPVLGAGGEALPQDSPELLNTMAAPGAVALDASRFRLELVSQVGVDCTAAALDAATTIRAANSLELMLCHQLAALHSTAMKFMARANLQQDPKTSISTLNASMRAMDTYQRGILTVKRMRSSGNQSILIKHIDARGGGMVSISGEQPKGAGGRS